jgi:hypothetical protein
MTTVIESTVQSFHGKINRKTHILQYMKNFQKNIKQDINCIFHFYNEKPEFGYLQSGKVYLAQDLGTESPGSTELSLAKNSLAPSPHGRWCHTIVRSVPPGLC